MVVIMGVGVGFWKNFSTFIQKLTLRKRILYLFSIAVFIPFLITVFLSYNTIYSILENKLEDSARNSLVQTQSSMENTIDNLAQVSHQFIYPSTIAQKIDQYLEAEDIGEEISQAELIQTELDYISYSNASIGLAVYMSEKHEPTFRNMIVRDDFSLADLPLIGSYLGADYYGPHISMNPLNTQYVISKVSEVNIPNQEPYYIYLESSFRLTKTLFDANQLVNNSFYLILNDQDEIIFSELNVLFPVNEVFKRGGNSLTSGVTNGYYWFLTTSRQGWSVVSFIPQAEYNKEKNIWISQMAILGLVFLVLTLLIAFLIWKMIYRPMNQFDSEIKAIANRDFRIISAPTNIPEFDQFLDELQDMKRKISNLIMEVESKEKKRADLEIEKLMYQINPHFLMNTLDTVHWLAVIHKQDEIDDIITSLNKLLYYNLKRGGKTSTIQEELDSLEQYCQLQKARYQFTFRTIINVNEETLQTPVPRFILQPVVENAIYHGLDDEGEITVTINKEEKQMIIEVKDTGSGFSEEEAKKMFSTNEVGKRKGGIGIGLNYVKRIMESHYNNKSHLKVISEKGVGTTVIFSIPVE